MSEAANAAECGIGGRTAAGRSAGGPTTGPIGWPRIGVDIGGTKIAAGLVGPDGSVRFADIRPTPAHAGPRAVLDAVRDAVEGVRAAAAGPVAAIGVGAPGVVDASAGTVLSSTALMADWAGTPVRAYLRAAFPGVAVAVDNDVNAMALGELRFGAAAGLDSVLYVSVGTGIGGAYAIGGRLVRGAHHAAGEIGHLVASGSRPCSCGGIGHVESVASGPAIEAAYAEACGASGPTGAMTERVGLREIVRRADAGDPAAAAAIAGAAEVLGTVLGGLTCAFDPEAVVLGGGVAGIGARFTEPLARALRRNLLPAMTQLPLLRAALGTNAPLVGAAALLDDAGITGVPGLPGLPGLPARPDLPDADAAARAVTEIAADGAANVTNATNEERP